MATSFALTGRTKVVRLSQVPYEVRVATAEKAIERWGLSGLEALHLRLVAETGSPDAELSVDVAKIEKVMNGKPVPGSFPKLEDLGVPK